MDFKVDYISLDKLGEEVLAKNEDLESLFSDLIGIINELNTSWTGPDYENFKTISTNYINGLNKTTEELKYIGEYIRKSAKVYSDNDNNFKNEMKKIGDDVNVHR